MTEGAPGRRLIACLRKRCSPECASSTRGAGSSSVMTRSSSPLRTRGVPGSGLTMRPRRSSRCWTWHATREGARLQSVHTVRISSARTAAEAGHLYRSDDGGASWLELPSPYQGSFFGVLLVAGDAVLAYGLRGNLFSSQDAGRGWQRIETGPVAMLD